MSNNELHWKDQEQELWEAIEKGSEINRLKIQLADMVVAWQDSDNTKEALKYYQKRRNLINQIKELESDKSS